MRKIIITAIILLSMCGSSYAWQHAMCTVESGMFFSTDLESLKIALHLARKGEKKLVKSMFNTRSIGVLKKGASFEFDYSSGEIAAFIPPEAEFKDLRIYALWPRGWVCD